MGDSLLKGTKGLVCQLGPSHREVWCLPGAWVRDITRRLLRLIQPSDYSPLLVAQVGRDKVDEKSPRAIKKDFKALGQLVEGTGAQVVFSSIPSVAGKNAKKNRTHLVNMYLKDQCHWWNFIFFNHEVLYTTPGLLETDGVHLSSKGKRIRL